MARPAGSTPVRFVDVQIVQIQVSVSKIGKTGRFFLKYYIFRVTTEAEFVVLHTEGRVELWGIRLGQKTEVLAAVSDVTPAAIVVGNGPMLELLALDLVGKWRQDFVFAYFLGLAMAGHAESRGLFFKQELRRRSVWGMAVHTTSDISHDTVLIRRIISDFLYIFMAGVAEKWREVLDHLWVAAPVRVMTADAVVFGRFVNHAVFLQFVLHHDMTAKTKLAGFGYQQILVVGAVGFVAGGTFPDGHGSMYKLKAIGDSVALGTKGR